MAAAAFLTAWAAGAAEQKEQRQYIAVLRFDADASVSESLRESLEESMRNYLSSALPGYTVLDGKTQIQVLIDSGLDPVKACEGSCALDTARRLNAKVFLSGSIRKPGELYRAFIRCYQASDGAVLGSIQIKGKSGDDLLEEVNAQGDRLLGRLKAMSVPAEPQPAPPQVAPQQPIPQQPVIAERGPAAAGGPQGFLTVITQPKGDVSIDGEAAGQTPLRRRSLASGSHIVLVTSKGYSPLSRNVEVEAGREATVSEQLAELKKVGTIEIALRPPGARLTLDGRLAGGSVIDDVPVGRHKLRAELANHKPAEREVQVDIGEVARVSLDLEPFPGRVRLSSSVEAECRLDGRSAGSVRSGRDVTIDAPAGPHQISCTSGGYQDYSGRVDVPAGETASHNVSMSRRYTPPAPSRSSSRSYSSPSTYGSRKTYGLSTELVLMPFRVSPTEVGLLGRSPDAMMGGVLGVHRTELGEQGFSLATAFRMALGGQQSAGLMFDGYLAGGLGMTAGVFSFGALLAGGYNVIGLGEEPPLGQYKLPGAFYWGVDFRLRLGMTREIHLEVGRFIGSRNDNDGTSPDADRRWDFMVGAGRINFGFTYWTLGGGDGPGVRRGSADILMGSLRIGL